METFHNPVQSVDNEQHVWKIAAHNGLRLPSGMEVIDSEYRPIQAGSTPGNFQLTLTQSYHNVQAIRLSMATIDYLSFTDDIPMCAYLYVGPSFVTPTSLANAWGRIRIAKANINSTPTTQPYVGDDAFARLPIEGIPYDVVPSAPTRNNIQPSECDDYIYVCNPPLQNLSTVAVQLVRSDTGMILDPEKMQLVLEIMSQTGGNSS